MIRLVKNQLAHPASARAYLAVVGVEEGAEVPVELLFTRREVEIAAERALANLEDIDEPQPADEAEMSAFLYSAADLLRRRLLIRRAEQAEQPVPVAALSLSVDHETGEITVTDESVPADGHSLVGRTVELQGEGGAMLETASASPHTFAPVPPGVYTVTLMAWQDNGQGAVTSVQVSTQPPATGDGQIILLTVDNPANLKAADIAVRDQLESWGYTVRVADDSLGVKAIQGDEDLFILGPSAFAGAYLTAWKLRTVPIVMMMKGTEFMGLGTSLSTDLISADLPIFPHPAITQSPGSYAILDYEREKKGTVNWVREPPRDAQPFMHLPGDRHSPVSYILERGDALDDDVTPVPARRVVAFGVGLAYNFTEAAWHHLRDLVAWALSDPGEGSPIARHTLQRDWDSETTTLTLTDRSTVPAGASVALTSWRLLSIAQEEIAVRTGPRATFSVPSGHAYLLDHEVRDSAGRVHARRVRIIADQVQPYVSLATAQSTQGAQSSSITCTTTVDARGVTITRYRYELRTAEGTTLIRAYNGGPSEAQHTFSEVPDGEYLVRVLVSNTDGGTGLDEQMVICPQPLGTARAEVVPVGLEAYAYDYSVPAPGETITYREWDFDLDREGTHTASGPGVHAKGVIIDAPGVYRWRCRVTQSHGGVTEVTGTWEAWQPVEWAEHQDYTRPPLPPTKRTVWADAQLGDDGHDGLSASAPVKTLQRLRQVVQSGDLVHLRGDFAGSNIGLQIQAGTPEAWTIYRRWPGAPEQPRLTGRWQGTSGDPAVVGSGRSYWALEDLHINGRYGVDQPERGKSNHGVGVVRGSHIHVVDCTIDGGQHGMHLTGVSDFWFDGLRIDRCGSDVTATKGNSGECIWMYDECRDGTIVRSSLGRAGHAAVTLGIHGASRKNLRVRMAHSVIENTWAGSMGVAGAHGCLFEHLDIRNIALEESLGNVGSKGGVGVRGTLNVFRHIRVYNPKSAGLQVQSLFAVQVQNTIRNHVHNITIHGAGDNSLKFGIQGQRSHCQDNLIENIIFTDGQKRNHPGNGNGWWANHWHGIWFDLYHGDPWIVTNMWDPENGNVAGNVIRHTTLTPHAAITPYRWLLFVRRPTEGGNKPYSRPADFSAPGWTHNLEIDPGYRSVDPASPDFLKLAPGSPMIDAGHPVPTFTHRGAAPDIGWDETGG